MSTNWARQHTMSFNRMRCTEIQWMYRRASMNSQNTKEQISLTKGSKWIESNEILMWMRWHISKVSKQIVSEWMFMCIARGKKTFRTLGSHKQNGINYGRQTTIGNQIKCLEILVLRCVRLAIERQNHA